MMPHFRSRTYRSREQREAAVMTPEQEVLIRRAVRHVVVSARSEDPRADVELVFDLFAFLPPEVQALIDDETARTLGDLIGVS